MAGLSTIIIVGAAAATTIKQVVIIETIAVIIDWSRRTLQAKREKRKWLELQYHTSLELHWNFFDYMRLYICSKKAIQHLINRKKQGLQL